MLRLALLLIVLSFPAQAKPAKWWDTDCGKMPIRVEGEFVCKSGQTIPANDIRLYHATSDTEIEFVRYYFMAIDGMRYFIPLSGKALIKEFEAIDPWARGVSWSPAGSGALLAVGKDWSCLYHRSLHDEKRQGYRHALYLTYCKPGGDIPGSTVGELLKKVSWD